MSFHFLIGLPAQVTLYGETFSWGVAEQHDRAPRVDAFDYTSERWRKLRQNTFTISYGVWEQFLARTDLSDLFFGPAGLIADHPGCMRIETYHLVAVSAALQRVIFCRLASDIRLLTWMQFWMYRQLGVYKDRCCWVNR
jgi:hypothetical protein